VALIAAAVVLSALAVELRAPRSLNGRKIG
jgi:hypothetical protein